MGAFRGIAFGDNGPKNGAEKKGRKGEKHPHKRASARPGHPPFCAAEKASADQDADKVDDHGKEPREGDPAEHAPRDGTGEEEFMEQDRKQD